jgi:chitin disaccharide deacetylase
MLIINADDFGYNRAVTDAIISCQERKLITSTSAMVFMEDSERSAHIAHESGLEVGLHLNFTEGFSGDNYPLALRESHQRIARFLRRNRYFLVLYNPFLKNDFEYVYRHQYEEFTRLYGCLPTHINGHHHMHLCSNVLFDKLIPKESKIRKSFSFSSSEKGYMNRCYRSMIDRALQQRYKTTDFFFSIVPLINSSRLRAIVDLSHAWNVELMVHPQNGDEYGFLMSDAYAKVVAGANLVGYGSL